jgi:hypothetical protein
MAVSIAARCPIAVVWLADVLAPDGSGKDAAETG